uniref:Phycocyanin alpha phycocyanobilin lyase; CpcF n=1 Tax=Paulinella chromatophora TaxID=39717 RepID=B1X531_PAUCH|nr:phycocyanin alpha phycocyanobilin lyase; CpcF [Paulinella chromatophora]ACB43050.1 phycocyanin alpha phycocyanobilin lyase; CpcF [Paulinella chromatophora]
MSIIRTQSNDFDYIEKPELIDLISAVKKSDNTLDLISTTRTLAKARTVDGIPTLLEVLGFNNPGAAIAAVDGLVALGEKAVIPLLTNLDQYNYGARAWGIRALALIGDVRGIEVLEIALKDDIAPSVRRAAARGLGNLNLMPLLPAEQILIEERCLIALETGCHDAEWIVRYAVVVGLECCTLKNCKGLQSIKRARRALKYLYGTSEKVVKERSNLALKRLATL